MLDSTHPNGRRHVTGLHLKLKLKLQLHLRHASKHGVPKVRETPSNVLLLLFDS